MTIHLIQAIARRLIIENPASMLFNLFDGEIERLDVQLERWAFARLEKVHHKFLETLLTQKMKHFLVKASAAPFWKSLFDSASFDPNLIKSCRDIERLPVTNRQQLRSTDISYRSNMKLSKKALGGFVGTSGTTGAPIGLYSGKKAEIRSKALLSWIVGKIQRETGAQKSSPLIMLNLGAATHAGLYKHTLFIDNLELENKEKRFKIIYPLILQKKPDILYAYPSNIKRLIYLLKHDGIKFNFFKAIIYLAEHLHDSEKMFIKEFFGCPLYSFYGTKECSFVAMECGRNEGFHLLKGWGYLEIMSPGGAVLPLGSWGRVVYTNFENEATPFIRYDTGDKGMLYDGGLCACGITGLKLTLEGRTADSITLPNGTSFPVIKLSGGVSRIFHNRILQLQFHEFDDRIGVNIVPVRQFSENEIKELVLLCQKIVGAPVKFDISFKERLIVSPGGKTPLLIKNGITI